MIPNLTGGAGKATLNQGDPPRCDVIDNWPALLKWQAKTPAPHGHGAVEEVGRAVRRRKAEMALGSAG
jgi:hypothetical protein